jgi:hypothetical protein
MFLSNRLQPPLKLCSSEFPVHLPCCWSKLSRTTAAERGLKFVSPSIPPSPAKGSPAVQQWLRTGRGCCHSSWNLASNAVRRPAEFKCPEVSSELQQTTCVSSKNVKVANETFCSMTYLNQAKKGTLKVGTETKLARAAEQRDAGRSSRQTPVAPSRGFRRGPCGVCNASILITTASQIHGNDQRASTHSRRHESVQVLEMCDIDSLLL